MYACVCAVGLFLDSKHHQPTKSRKGQVSEGDRDFFPKGGGVAAPLNLAALAIGCETRGPAGLSPACSGSSTAWARVRRPVPHQLGVG